jgi:hypothetical protein
LIACLLIGCATQGAPDVIAPDTAQVRDTPRDAVSLVNRVTWGATAASVRQLQEQGVDRYLEAQLQPV